MLASWNRNETTFLFHIYILHVGNLWCVLVLSQWQNDSLQSTTIITTTRSHTITTCMTTANHCQCKYSYILISFKGYHSAGTNEFPKIFPNHCSPPYPCCDYVCHAYITSVQSVVPVHNKRKRIFDKNVHKDFINGESLKQPEINFLLPNHQRQSTEDCVLPAHSQWPVHRIDQTKLQVIEV